MPSGHPGPSAIKDHGVKELANTREHKVLHYEEAAPTRFPRNYVCARPKAAHICRRATSGRAGAQAKNMRFNVYVVEQFSQFQLITI